MGYYARPTIRGTDRLDGVDGPVIFAANHASHADTPLLLTSIPEPWRNRLAVAAAADYFFGNRVTSTLSALGIGAIPIERTRVSKASMALPVRLLQNRWSVVIYPEGGRSPDGWGSGFRPGVALISKLADVPVVPVYISGTAKVLARGRTWPSRHRSVVVFGQPLTWTDEDDNRSFTDRIEGSVRGLADEAVTDWWTARRRFHAGASPDLSGPSTAGWRRRWALAPSHGPRRERWPRL